MAPRRRAGYLLDCRRRGRPRHPGGQGAPAPVPGIMRSMTPSDREPSSRDSAGLRELRREVSELRRTNEQARAEVRKRSPRRAGPRRRLGLVLAAVVVLIVAAASANGLFGRSDSFPPPSSAALAGLNMRARIVAIANSQVGYSAQPSDSYCNKFSAYWSVGATDCPSGESSEEWCADFAAWAWQKAGVQFAYSYASGDINAGAASFYEWGVANGEWHPATSGYVAAPGDVAVYGLSLEPQPSATHVAIVTDDPPRQRGPDVVNGDGDRTGFSVVETGTDEVRADAGHNENATLAGYVSPS
jgi:hypothetical protein